MSDYPRRAEFEQALSEVVFWFYAKFPFYALLLERCPIYINSNIPTLCVTRSSNTPPRMLINPKFFLTTEHNTPRSRTQQLFLIAHEVCHLVFRHLYRQEGRDGTIYNIAADCIINDMLRKEFEQAGYSDIPTNALYIEGLSDTYNSIDPNWTTEDLYELLIHKIKHKSIELDFDIGESGQDVSDSPRGEALSNKAEGIIRIRGNYNQDLNNDEKGGTAIRNENESFPEGEESTNHLVEAALQNAATRGLMPGNSEAVIKNLLRPKIVWTEQLRATFSTVISRDNITDASFRKPNRRFFHQDIYLPSGIGYKARIATAADISGSMCQCWEQALAEIDGMRKRYNTEIYHMWFDTEIKNAGWIQPDRPFSGSINGFGGTDFQCIFDHLYDTGVYREIDLLAIFTDMYAPFPDMAPSYPVIWVSFSDVKPPFGKLIEATSYA